MPLNVTLDSHGEELLSAHLRSGRYHSPEEVITRALETLTEKEPPAPQRKKTPAEAVAHIRESLSAWHLRVPQLRADWDDLQHTVGQSVADLASLRIRGGDDPGAGRLPAAGMPWFMTIFGRDTIRL